MTRLPVYDALFAKVTALAPFTTKGRRLPPWYDVAPAEQMPACFLALARETPRALPNGPRLVWSVEFQLHLYVATTGDLEPMVVLAPLVDAVEAALAPALPDTQQTLGGLCQSCKLTGAIEYFEGTLGDIAVAIVPITAEVTP